MFDFASLITIAAAFFVAAASPGPATIALASVSMRAGRKTGLLFAMGLSLGLAFWGIVAAAGLGAVLQASSHALMAMKLLGGVYLLWLAYQSARSAARRQGAVHRAEHQSKYFMRGMLLNLSNPKAVFAWMAVLALGLDGKSNTGHVIVATGICVFLGFLIYTVYALLFSTSGVMGGYARARRWLDGAVAGLFAIAGIGLIRAAFIRQ